MLNFLLSLFTCSHNLGWPWHAATGETYRTCSKCGGKFEVDADWQPICRAATDLQPKPAAVSASLVTKQQAEVNFFTQWQADAMRVARLRNITMRDAVRRIAVGC